MAFSLGQPTVGIVIRADAVEMVQLSRGLKGVKVLGSVRVPLGDPQVSAQPEDARMAEAIRSALAASSVEQGAFRVRASDARNPSQAFYWEIKAVRVDVPKLAVERGRESAEQI